MTPTDELAHPVELLKRMLYWRMAFFSIVILLAGIAIGASGAYIWLARQKARPTPPPTVSVNRIMHRLQSQLKLTPAQTARIRPLLHQCLIQLEEVRNQARPQINQHLRQMNRGIVAVLDNQQKRKWRGIAKRLTALLKNDAVRRPVTGLPRNRSGPKPQTKRPASAPAAPNKDTRVNK